MCYAMMLVNSGTCLYADGKASRVLSSTLYVVHDMSSVYIMCNTMSASSYVFIT